MLRKVNEPKREAVARVAYELYLRHGGVHGHDVEDWLTAERMLQEKLKNRGKASRHPRVSRRLEDKRLL